MDKNYLTIYADELDHDAWEGYCDVCHVPRSANCITIKFNDEDVSYEEGEE